MRNIFIRLSQYWFVLPLVFVVFWANKGGAPNFLHTDDHEYYFMSTVLHDTGSLRYQDPFYAVVGDDLFTPSGSISNAGMIVPKRPYGLFYLSAAALFIGEKGPLYLIGMISIIGAIALYHLMAMLFGKRAGMIAGVLYSTSIPVLYWSVLLLPNAPALSFFILSWLAFFHFVKSNDHETISYRQLALFCLLAATSIWLRYEYVAFYLISAIIIVWRYWRWFSLPKVAFAAVSTTLLLLPILALNQIHYGAPLTFGYTFSNTAVQLDESVIESGAEKSTTVLNSFESLYNRFFRKFFSAPNFGRAFQNTWDWVLFLFPLISLFGLVGIVRGARKGSRDQRTILYALSAISLLWLYDSTGGYHWGEGTDWVGSVYMRYLLPVYLCLFIGAAYLFADYSKGKGKWIVSTVLAIFVTSNLASGFSGSLGIAETRDIREAGAEINNVVNDLEENPIVVSNLYSKMLTSKSVGDPANTIHRSDKDLLSGDLISVAARTRLADQLQRLLEVEDHFYLLEAPWHKATYFGIQKALFDGSFAQLSLVSEFTSARYGVVEIYRVSKAPN